MSTATDQRDQIVSSAIREVSHIATLPEITLKIVELVEDPKSTAQDLNKVISGDPALCSRILKVVNSSFYGLPGQIASINRAIVMLGLNAVKNIAIAASLAKLFRGGELTQSFSAKNIWNHSSGAAVASKVVADALKLGLSDEAFLAGLIHDIGFMVEMQYDRGKLIDVLHRVGADNQGIPANSMLDAEIAIFGATHQEFGAGLCEKWKFPKSFVTVTGYHHRPLDLPADSRTLACIVYVGDRLTHAQPQGFRQDLLTLDYDQGVLDHLRVGRDRIADLEKQFAEAIKSAASLLG